MKSSSSVQWSRVWPNVKSTLDVVATLMVICLVGVLLRSHLSPWPTKHGSGALDAPDAQADLAPPHSLKGAVLLGNSKARVAVVEYSDFECGFCARFASTVLPEFKRKYVESGRVLYAFRHLPLSNHKHAQAAAAAANCAARQGRFWEMHDRLFQLSPNLGDVQLRSAATAIGLDAALFNDCVAHHAPVGASDDQGYASKVGISATPTFLLGIVRPDGRVDITTTLVGLQTDQQLGEKVDGLIADGGRNVSWLRGPQ